jgi:hypothetical protein
VLVEVQRRHEGKNLHLVGSARGCEVRRNVVKKITTTTREDVEEAATTTTTDGLGV